MPVAVARATKNSMVATVFKAKTPFIGANLFSFLFGFAASSYE